MNQFSAAKLGLRLLFGALVITLAGVAMHTTAASLRQPARTVAERTPEATPRLGVTPFPTVILPPMTPVPTPASFPTAEPIPTEPPVPTVDPERPFHLKIAAMRFPDTAISLNQSTVVALGTVTDVLPARWSTADGQRPPNPHANDNQLFIYTPVLIEVESYLIGTQPETQLMLFAVGGAVGQDSVAYESNDLHTFHEGEQVLVFGKRAGQEFNGHSIHLVMERYTVTSTGVAFNSLRSTTLQQLMNEITEASK